MEMNIDPLIFDGDTNVTVVVHKGDKLQSKTATPSDEAQTISPDEGFFGLSSVTVEAIEEGSATTPDTEITATPSITAGADGLITATVSESESITPDVEPGYVSGGTAGTVNVSGSASVQLATQGASSITPTESAQTAVPSGKYTTGDTTVNAIPSDYVGSGVTRRSGTDLSASGATVSVPSGFYAESASKAVASGAEGIPSASKGAVSNHAVSITPSVTNTEGYINGGTKTGDPIAVTASELDSGSKNITANGNGQDVVGYAEVDVNVPNSYSASDEGKVVSNGALTAQTSATYTDNGTYDTTLKNSVTVNVSGGGGGGIGDLILTQPLGTISNVSTSVVDTGYDLTVTGINSYDLLIIIIRTDPQSAASRHRATTSLVFISGTTDVATKNVATVVTNKQQLRKESNTVMPSVQASAGYGVYPYNATLADNTVTMNIYARRGDTYSGSINGYYTAYVYGVKLYKDDY